MVYDSIRGQAAYVLKHIRMVESAHRTDGSFPLYERMKGLLMNLDKQSLSISTYQSNYSPVFAVSHEYYTIYYLHNGTDAFIIAITIEDNGTKYNLRTNQRITTDVQFADIPSAYKQYPNGGKFESGNLEFVCKTTSCRGKQRRTYNIFDHSTGKMLFLVNFDELIPISQHNDGIYGKGYYYGDKGWYKLFDNGYFEYICNDKIDESKLIHLGYSDICQMIKECLCRILKETPNGRIGEYEWSDGFFRTIKAPSLKQFGYFNDVRMYYSPSHTYCLLRREDNGTLFFAEIMDAPEIGENDTKYVPRRPSEVPIILLRDAQSLLRKAKNQHTLLS